MNTLPNNSSRVVDFIDSNLAANLISHVADAVLIINEDGVIENVLNNQSPGLQSLKNLIGKSFVDSASSESRKKISD